ncbi:hypothetical protein [Streptomyces sp. ODS28]|uniref:tetratricopeptide repeat protein n=1 Tax=Streptomyces sp. ODS28 TaxID=3136688 RepID=UPI0031ED391C
MPSSDRRTRTPNHALRALLRETEWTQEAFARAIAALGAEAGVHLRYDRTSVAQWLRGSRPAPRVRLLMAEALSRKLGRPVAVAELGMGDSPQRRGARSAHPADRVAALTRPVVGPPRAAQPPAAPYQLTLLTRPRHPRAGSGAGPGTGPGSGSGAGSTPGPGSGSSSGSGPNSGPAPGSPPAHGAQGAQCGTAPRAGSPAPGAPGAPGAPSPAVPQLRPPGPAPASAATPRPTHTVRRTSPDEVASVREHVRFFAQQADRHGGGHIRTPLAAYLSGLVRRLRTGGDGPHHAQLLAGAARLSYLLARVYADEQRHGLAQRAFLTAAELAEEGGDPEGVALARRALSTQAHQLGHAAHSLALAESACEAAPSGAEPSARAFLYAGLAVAQAAGGERDRAVRTLGRAEHELARAPADLTSGPESPNGEPVGAYQDAALLYQAGKVRAELGDRAGAIGELRSSLRQRPEGERRSRALSHAELAELLLASGELEEACTAWQVFLEDCSLVRSGRARRARDRMPRLLRPYAGEHCVQALLLRFPVRGTDAR